MDPNNISKFTHSKITFHNEPTTVSVVTGACLIRFQPAVIRVKERSLCSAAMNDYMHFRLENFKIKQTQNSEIFIFILFFYVALILFCRVSSFRGKDHFLVFGQLCRDTAALWLLINPCLIWVFVMGIS